MAINTGINEESRQSDYQMNVRLYRFLRKIRVDAKALYITHLNDDYVLLTVYDGQMIYTASVESSRIEKFNNSPAAIYEFSADMPLMYDLSGSQAIGRAELIIKISKQTVIKYYREIE